MRRSLALLTALAAALALTAAPAAAQEPPDVVAPGSNWISGDLLSQTGLNCSTAILGSSYTEIMVSGIAAYGGAPGGGVPNVNEPYWTSFLVSIPGNPCGSGSSAVATTLILPPNTQIDTSRSIRCFGLGRSPGSTWQELTGGSWSFLGSSGPYCPTQASVSPYHQGGNQIGFRPLANGQMFWLFVPVKSSSELKGAAGPSPGHGFTWLTDATGVYANPGRSFVWANVFNSGAGTPFIYFARNPTVLPFWKDDAPNHPDTGLPTKSRAEWFANLYSGFHQGNLCWELWYGSPGTGTLAADCTTPSASWNSFVPSTADSFFVVGTGSLEGPNGGYVPFSYDDDPPGTNFTIRWKFSYNDGTPKTVTKDAPFRTLNGADADGDGVGANEDSCPSDKGTLSNGCLPGTQPDPDKDGVYGTADLCPNTEGNGALNGCPGGIVPNVVIPEQTQQPQTLVATLLVKKGAAFKRSALAKGAPVKFECTVNSAASATLSIAAKIARKLGIKLKRKQKTVAIASGKGQCKAGSGGSLKLKLLRAHARKVKRAKKGFAAALAVKLSAPGQTAVTTKRSVKVR